MHMMQLWVNLPRKDKTRRARLPADHQGRQFPRSRSPDGGKVRVIAGEYEGARGPAHTFTPITMLDARLHGGRDAAGRAAGALQRARGRRRGPRARRRRRRRGAGELVLFANDGERLELTADEATHVIVLAGEPIDEPIVQYGPFVMNTLDEIRQAIDDVQSGGFGDIPD